MNDDKPVDRCDCTGLSFARLLELGGLEAAMSETGAGRECSGCLPYLKLVFASGETEFAIDDPRLAGYE